ncbi:unnamed protein product [Coffea canephora]|uniref:Uncharacterized protein n=1 Tax=Coffea canephora TaxID=49390 RepID=A0A068UYL3_COFCA|nr:unnamed protein product [Coffea canephora]
MDFTILYTFSELLALKIFFFRNKKKRVFFFFFFFNSPISSHSQLLGTGFLTAGKILRRRE